MAWAGQTLGLSSPTLRRHLEAENTTFSAIVDEVRREIAQRELRSNRTVGEIAFRLGFSSASAFDRAFKRWNGQSPKAYRTECRGKSGR